MRTIKMTAKKAGTCRNCGKPIAIGQSIYWARGAGAVHANCETAAYTSSNCTACNGSGRTWRNDDCPVCGGSGRSKPASVTSTMGGIDVDLAYEDSCREMCGL